MLNGFKLRALGSRVIAERFAPKEKVGLIHVPDVAQEKSLRCTVLAVGPKVKDLQEGDVVIIGGYVDLEWEERNLVVFQEADIRGVVVNG